MEGHTSGGRIHQFYLCSEQWEKLLLGFVCLFCWPVFSLFSVPLVEHRYKGGISESTVCAFMWVVRTFRNSITGYQITKFINYKHRGGTNMLMFNYPPWSQSSVHWISRPRRELCNITQLSHSSYLQPHISPCLLSALSPSPPGTISFSFLHNTLRLFKSL